MNKKRWTEEFIKLNPDIEVIGYTETKSDIILISIYHKELDLFSTLEFNEDPLKLTKAINKEIEDNIKELENSLKLYKKVLRRRKKIVNGRK